MDNEDLREPLLPHHHTSSRRSCKHFWLNLADFVVFNILIIKLILISKFTNLIEKNAVMVYLYWI